jgi:hypothetical protein
MKILKAFAGAFSQKIARTALLTLLAGCLATVALADGGCMDGECTGSDGGCYGVGSLNCSYGQCIETPCGFLWLYTCHSAGDCYPIFE